MDILKREEGVSIIESLVSIVILGLIVVSGVMVMSGLFTHPRALLKGEACQLASSEIDFSLKHTSLIDTSYTNSTGNLLVKRHIAEIDSLTRIEVKVTYKGTSEEVATLAVYDYR
ncbi:MAG: hypothetical protein COW85_08310 [Ignavibacteria bacterium CG22_combo_CG10-13_8_21_14_all_37_15]|nr:MAG: hypothetical protein COW85_08310 [Ignavibacteria bacterium CG22_combo_CG10-13_8_21_14_all_37_15]